MRDVSDATVAIDRDEELDAGLGAETGRELRPRMLEHARVRIGVIVVDRRWQRSRRTEGSDNAMLDGLNLKLRKRLFLVLGAAMRRQHDVRRRCRRGG